MCGGNTHTYKHTYIRGSEGGGKEERRDKRARASCTSSLLLPPPSTGNNLLASAISFAFLGHFPGVLCGAVPLVWCPAGLLLRAPFPTALQYTPPPSHHTSPPPAHARGGSRCLLALHRVVLALVSLREPAPRGRRPLPHHPHIPHSRHRPQTRLARLVASQWLSTHARHRRCLSRQRAAAATCRPWPPRRTSCSWRGWAVVP